MFGVDTKNLRNTIIKHVKRVSAIKIYLEKPARDEMAHPPVGDNWRQLEYDAVKKDVKIVLTDSILKQIGKNAKKVDEMVDAPEIKELNSFEQMIYFSVLYFRTQEIGSEVDLLRNESGLRLAEQELNLIKKYCDEENWGEVESFGIGLFKIATEIRNNPYMVFLALYYLGLADFSRKNYERAKNNWEDASKYYPFAKEFIGLFSDQTKNLDYLYETVQMGLKEFYKLKP